jgi:hypothetical protein
MKQMQVPGRGGSGEGDWQGIPVNEGTLVLFPTYLKHVGDVHRGDTDRISIASNIIIK